MPDFYKSIKITQPTPGGPLVEQVVGAVQVSTGTAVDAGKLVVLDASGVIDSSMISGSSAVSVNGVTVSNPNFNDTTPAAPGGSTNVIWQHSGSFVSAYVTATSTSFSGITTGTNTTATMTVGTGATLTFSGTGVVNANQLEGISITNTPAHEGQLLIVQPGLTTLAYADPLVQGLYAAGSTISAPVFVAPTTIQPVLIGGSDGTILRNILTDSSGRPIVNINGTVAVTQSTSPWIIASNKGVNTVVPGTTNLGVLPAQANAASQTWTEGNQVPLSVDLTGSLRTTATFTGTLSNNITQWNSVNLGSPSAFGTSPGTVNVIGTNSVVYAIKSGSPAALITDGAGNLDVNTQAAVFAAANGSAVPPSAVWLGASDGTNLQGLRVSTSTDKELRVAIYQGGNPANVSSNRLLVDPSGTTIAVTQSTSPWVTADNQLVTQGSTTSGQKGPLIQGAVTTNDPTYTTAQTDPLSLTTTGHLRTQDSAEGVANGSTAPPTNALYVAGKGADGFLHPLSTDNSGVLNVNATFGGTITPGFVSDIIQSGTITNTQNVFLSAQGAASIVFNITGTWTGTIVFEAQLPDLSWITATAYPVFTGGASVTQATTNGQWQLPVGGFQAIRLRGNTVNSGTATVNLEKGAGGYSFFVQQLSPSDLNATVVQGTAGTQAQAWFVKITDGSNPLGTSSNPFVVAGSLTNNNAAPVGNNVGVLPARATGAAPTYTDGDQVLLSVDTTGALRVSSSGTFTPALTADITATGTITSNQTVTLVTQGTGTTQFNITGSWAGTIVFEASVDGVNFVSAKCLPRYPTTFPEASQATANGQWAIATGGLAKFRLRGANVTSGTATIWIEGGAGAQDIQTLAMVFDPVSGNVPAVKGSTTVPVAADNALVVALSPNSSQFSTSTTATPSLPGSNPQTIGTSSSAIVNSNASRKEITITNTGTTVIFLGFGSTPTNTAYHVVLQKCTLANDGTGGTWTSDIWKGSVNGISSAVGGTVNVVELT